MADREVGPAAKEAANDQLLDVERLRDVVVRALPERADGVGHAPNDVMRMTVVRGEISRARRKTVSPSTLVFDEQDPKRNGKEAW